MKRKEFIQTICPALVIAMMNAPVIVSCSKEEIPEEDSKTVPKPEAEEEEEEQVEENQEEEQTEEEQTEEEQTEEEETEEEEGSEEEEENEEEIAESILEQIDESGYIYTEGKLYIDIENINFEELQTVGQFVNHDPQGVLVLRRADDIVMAFDHCCPHQGATNLWSFSGDTFTCANHGNSFGIGEGYTAHCNSNTIFGNLKQFSATLDGRLVTVSFEE